MAAIVFDNVSKTYGNGVPAIDGFDLAIADGELLVLVGPSGCGKSTLMRMVAGLETVGGGAIRIGGKVVNDVPPQQRNAAMVFQNYALYPHMTVRRNLEFPLRMQKLSRGEIVRRVERTAQMLDLTELLERRPRALSGGQRQRVAMGRAIVRDADVFLMDEPLSNLDAKLRVQIRSQIAALQARLGVTTIYVTHDQAEAMTLGQRVAVMRSGRLQQVAPPRELYEHPANIFVAGFIGSPAMNIVRASLERTVEGEGVAVRLGAARLPLSAAVQTRQPGLTQWVGHELLVGIRPEALSLATAGVATLPVTVRTKESLGHENILYCATELQLVSGADSAAAVGEGAANVTYLAVVLPGHHAPASGTELSLAVDTQGLCLFTPDGVAIA